MTTTLPNLLRSPSFWGLLSGLLLFPFHESMAQSPVSFFNVGFAMSPWAMAGACFVLLQALFILSLLRNRAKRLQEEAESVLIAEISSKFINLPASEVDREIEEALRRVCEPLNIDLAVLWQWSPPNPEVIMPTHAYCAREELRPTGPMCQEQYPWALQQVLAGRTFAISTLDDYPEEAAVDRQTCQQYGIKAGICIPLLVGGESPVGALGINALRAERSWPEPLMRRLKLAAQIFANALARKRADYALRESEELNRATFEQAAVGIAHVAIDGRWLRVNDRLCEIVGYSREELLQLTYQDITHPRDLEQDRSLTQQFLTGGINSASLEKRYLRKDRSTVWVIISASLVRSLSGEAQHFIAVIKDISERKETEGRLRQLSLAVEQSPVLVVITDLQGKISYVNRMFCEVTGYTFEECAGQNPRILKSGELPHSSYKELWASITQGKTWRGEFHNRKKNGELYWEQAVISPVLDASGKVTHYVGVKEDITAQKLTQEAFRTATARLEAGTELANLGYYEVNYEASSCFMDARFREICGIPTEIDQSLEPVQFWMDHVHAEDRLSLLEQRQALRFGTLQEFSTEYRYVHPTQGQKWIQHIARQSPQTAPKSGFHSFGVVRDITARKEAELEAEELRSKLLHLTRVNTLGVLSGSLAHELNQPLGIILSNAEAAQELLSQEPPDVAEVQEILSDIVAANRRASDVIERLRALLKRGQVSLQPLQLNLILEEVLHFVRADLIGRGISLCCDFAPNLPPIAGDRVQLQQLVLNLILNAAEAMVGNAPGMRRLHLQTEQHGEQVRAMIRDEGEGLPPDISHLFQPFYTTKSQGLGLGLAICWSIVASHHGRLWAETHPERGAVFLFELPCTHEHS